MNEHHLHKLEQGVEAWNNWRVKVSDHYRGPDQNKVLRGLIAIEGAIEAHSNPDLSDAPLSGKNLSGANLSGINLEGWQVDDKTILVNVKCKYVYLLRDSCQNLERCPSDKYDFFPGEFTRLQGNLTILKKMVDQKKAGDLIRKPDPLSETFKSIKSQGEIDNNLLQEQVNYLKNRVDSLELQNRLILLSAKNQVLKYWGLYFLVLVTFLGGSWWIYQVIKNDSNSQISITVDYDVGTILGGIFVGGSAVIAATAYARNSRISGGGGRSGGGEGSSQ
jgi:hypothetical protein